MSRPLYAVIALAFAFLISVSPSRALEALSSDQVSNFLDASPAMFEAAPSLGSSLGDPSALLSGDVLTSSLSGLSDSGALTALGDVASQFGYSSVGEWAGIGDQILKAYAGNSVSGSSGGSSSSGGLGNLMGQASSLLGGGSSSGGDSKVLAADQKTVAPFSSQISGLLGSLN
ncbi:hypothetical protein ACTL6U_14200 [Rhodovibrionaceae bacterium A322]